jgi:YVTN family beta-propeller protein
MYASLFADNKVAVIDTQSLSVLTEIPVGASPTGLSVSPDGAWLFVANTNSNSISMIDTTTNQVVKTITTASRPRFVIAAAADRLFVSGDTGWQVNPMGGAAGADFSFYPGAIALTGDRTTLWSGTSLQPADLTKFDVSTLNPVALWSAPFNSVGSNGYNLTVSHDGKYLFFITGTGNNAFYQTYLYRTADMSVAATLYHTPFDVIFSPDDKYFYTSDFDIYSTTNMGTVGSFLPDGEVAYLSVTPSGRYLFASEPSTLNFGDPGLVQVFDTGRSVPEPTLLLLPCLSAIAAFGRNGRQRQASR